jgi:hypothetical protein
VATARNGRARLIPPVQAPSLGTRLTCGGQSPLPIKLSRVPYSVFRILYGTCSCAYAGLVLPI